MAACSWPGSQSSPRIGGSERYDARADPDPLSRRPAWSEAGALRHVRRHRAVARTAITSFIVAIADVAVAFVAVPTGLRFLPIVAPRARPLDWIAGVLRAAVFAL